jgi:transcriptional regulator of acetoin/glycerol metabolism
MPPSAAARRGDIDDDELKRLAESSEVTRKALARQAGLSERTLYRRLKALGLA